MEYELEINPIKLIKGYGLGKIMEETNYKALGINFLVCNSKTTELEDEGKKL